MPIYSLGEKIPQLPSIGSYWVAPDAQEDITHNLEDTSFRIVGSDYKNNFSFKHKYNHLLRNRPKGTEVDTHWSRYKGPIF